MLFERIPVQGKYECSPEMDGVKLYNYFHPPRLEEVKEMRKDARMDLIRGILIFVVTLALVIAIFAIGQYFAWWLLLAGIVAAGIEGGLFYLRLKAADKLDKELQSRIVTDKEMEQMEMQLLQGVKERGMEKLNLDEDEIKEADPLILHRYREGGDERRGEDGRLRRTEHLSTVFYFTRDTLYVYRYAFSLMNTITQQETMTLFYSDIVSVRVMETNMMDAKNGDSSWSVKTLELSATNGQKFQYIFMSDQMIDRAINAMQSLFRSKKTS